MDWKQRSDDSEQHANRSVAELVHNTSILYLPKPWYQIALFCQVAYFNPPTIIFLLWNLSSWKITELGDISLTVFQVQQKRIKFRLSSPHNTSPFCSYNTSRRKSYTVINFISTKFIFIKSFGNHWRMFITLAMRLLAIKLSKQNKHGNTKI